MVKQQEKIKKHTVHLVGAPPGRFGVGQIFGGSVATMYAIQESFKDSEKYELVIRNRNSFNSAKELNDFLKEGDISWLDETSLAQLLYKNGFDRPDVVGPITRSPVKRYNDGKWDSVYNSDWFYGGKVLRLNENEEKPICLKDEYKDDEFVSKVNFIRHAIDLDKFKPEPIEKKYILWAGMVARDAKNYPMFEEIMEYINSKGGLPKGYEFMVMNKYAIEDYIEALKSTAILVNTSKFESFCNAVNEARACGVCTLVREKFNGEYMFLDQSIQVKYTVEEYGDKILEILNSEHKAKALGILARGWVEDNCSFKCMREDIEKVFDEVIDGSI